MSLLLLFPLLLLRPPEVVHDTDGGGAGCVLCRLPDFLRGAFGDRTILICDTCEREYHVGCLRSHGLADLKEVGIACYVMLCRSLSSL
jgi:hypothetical protein